MKQKKAKLSQKTKNRTENYRYKGKKSGSFQNRVEASQTGERSFLKPLQRFHYGLAHQRR